MRTHRILIVLPAFNAEKTLEATIDQIPKASYSDLILVDDASRDNTIALARKLGIRTIAHKENLGYGGNLKTCLSYARKIEADVTIELHPDNQYDATQIPILTRKVLKAQCDLVIGSRFANTKGPRAYGMHWYRSVANRILSFFDRLILGLPLSEFHTGFRAYSKKFLATVPYRANKDNYTFSFEVIAQARYFGLSVCEIPVVSRYTKDSTSATIKNATLYALETFAVLGKYILQKANLVNFTLFQKHV